MRRRIDALADETVEQIVRDPDAADERRDLRAPARRRLRRLGHQGRPGRPRARRLRHRPGAHRDPAALDPRRGGRGPGRAGRRPSTATTSADRRDRARRRARRGREHRRQHRRVLDRRRRRRAVQPRHRPPRASRSTTPTRPGWPSRATAPPAASSGLVIVTTLGTGIGSALLLDGVLVPNSELGHLEIDGRNAESWAANSAREAEDLVAGRSGPSGSRPTTAPSSGCSPPTCSSSAAASASTPTGSCRWSTSPPRSSRPCCATRPASSAPPSSPPATPEPHPLRPTSVEELPLGSVTRPLHRSAARLDLWLRWHGLVTVAGRPPRPASDRSNRRSIRVVRSAHGLPGLALRGAPGRGGRLRPHRTTRARPGRLARRAAHVGAGTRRRVHHAGRAGAVARGAAPDVRPASSTYPAWSTPT